MRFHLRPAGWLCLTVLLFTNNGLARDLNFEDRILAQERIERVRYSHQLGAHLPFEEAVPRPLLQEKVRYYLQESLALDIYWRTPITESMLQAEMDRMVRQTRMPSRLRELFAALGNDPLLIRECLARPALADRMARSFYSSDSRLHTGERVEAEALRHSLVSGVLSPTSEHAGRFVEEWSVGSSVQEFPRGSAPPDPRGFGTFAGRRQEFSADELQRRLAALPSRNLEAGDLEEERDRYLIRVVLSRESTRVRLATYVVWKEGWDAWWATARSRLNLDSSRSFSAAPAPLPASGRDDETPGLSALSRRDRMGDLLPAIESLCPGDDQWINGALDDMPEPRIRHAAVWTGSLMLVWGGLGDQTLGSGGRYDPATDTWTPISQVGAPSPRYDASAVWTGSVMVVWGGINTDLGCCAYYATGGRYNPTTDTWSPTSTAGAPEQRAGASTVWTGAQMIVWGGSDLGILGTGGRYNPSTDVWSAVSTLQAPTPRMDHTAIWTGSQMIIWGGNPGAPNQYTDTGAIYTPSSDTWSPTSTHQPPDPRRSHSAVWTGSEMIVWGGETSAGVTNTGARYSVSSNRWTDLPTLGAPVGRRFHSSAWDGSHLIVWGGETDTFSLLDTGGLYSTLADSWTATSLVNAPTPRRQASALWTGNRMIVWGGAGVDLTQQSVKFGTGSRYDPSTNSWTPTSTGAGPSPRTAFGLIWTGSEAIVWGGFDGFNVLGTGARYDPALDTWSATSMLNAPAARNAHSAIWTGDRMIVWGGYGFPFLNTGARYDPIGDSWTPISVTGAPTPRYVHSAIWTGNRMVIWGGSEDGVTNTNTGGRYDPITDSWSATSLSGAPSGRTDFSTVWSGNRMIVWGGYDGTQQVDTGGLYDPVGNSWLDTTTANAPTPRDDHTAVWTGNRMLVWGGYDGMGTISGGLYDPTTNAWTSIATSGAPSSRYRQVGVWTGDRMIIWGGYSFGIVENLSPFLNTGRRYDPATDAWESVTNLQAPSRRIGYGVWTGENLFVWGGQVGGYLSTGGLYHVSLPSLFYQDVDGDGFGNPSVSSSACSAPPGFVTNATDCSDADGTVWSTPGEAQSLLWTDIATLSWSPPSSPGAALVHYDAIRSTVASDFTASGACVATDESSTSLSDPTTPLLQQPFYYLVRAQNSCPQGNGPLGSGSNGAPRAAIDCP